MNSIDIVFSNEALAARTGRWIREVTEFMEEECFPIIKEMLDSDDKPEFAKDPNYNKAFAAMKETAEKIYERTDETFSDTEWQKPDKGQILQILTLVDMVKGMSIFILNSLVDYAKDELTKEQILNLSSIQYCGNILLGEWKPTIHEIEDSGLHLVERHPGGKQDQKDIKGMIADLIVDMKRREKNKEDGTAEAERAEDPDDQEDCDKCPAKEICPIANIEGEQCDINKEDLDDPENFAKIVLKNINDSFKKVDKVKLKDLDRRLKSAVRKEDYEEAAKIRDDIANLEGE